jgi:hypothetical protein
MDIVDILKAFGMPTAFLFAILLAVWRASGWMAENVFKPLVQGHLSFLTRLTATLDRIEQRLEGRTEEPGVRGQ